MTVFASWLTRQALADRLALWSLQGSPVTSKAILEPSAGLGAIALGYLKAGVPPEQLTLIELHGGRYRHLRGAFPYSTVIQRDFELYESEQWEDGGPNSPPFGLAGMNPPSDDGMDTAHVEAATLLCERVTCLVRLAFVTGSERKRVIFDHCRLNRLAILSSRPDFFDAREPEERLLKSKTAKEADGSPKHDWCVCDLERMTGRHEGWTRERYPEDQTRVVWW